jgi:hypothetical protein
MGKYYNPADQVRIPERIRRAKSQRKRHSLGARALIESLVTSFIWLTPTDVLAIVEQLNDDITELNVRVALFHLVKAGKLEKRRDWGGRANGYQVKKPNREWDCQKEPRALGA